MLIVNNNFQKKTAEDFQWMSNQKCQESIDFLITILTEMLEKNEQYFKKQKNLESKNEFIKQEQENLIDSTNDSSSTNSNNKILIETHKTKILKKKIDKICNDYGYEILIKKFIKKENLKDIQ